MKRQMIIVAAALIGLAGGVSAGNPPAPSSRDEAIANLAARQAEDALLRSQLAEWEQVLAESNKARERYETFLRNARQAAEQEGQPSSIRSGPIAAEANQAIGRGDVAWSQIQQIKKRVAELEPLIADAKAQLDRFNKPKRAGASPSAGNAGPQATGMPNWSNPNPQSSGKSQMPASGPYPPMFPGGAMGGSGWGLPTTVPTGIPWPTPGGTSGHKHGPDGRDLR